MKKKFLTGLITGMLASGLATTAFATTLATYEFTILGTDLMSYMTANGGPTDSAVAAELYEGARKFTTYDEVDEIWGVSYRSYQSASQSDFINWADNSGDMLVDFNLWGYGGNALNWGETYKVFDWVDTPTSSSTDWEGYRGAWPWGNFDDYADNQPNYGEHYNDGQILSWWIPMSYTSGLGFGSGEADVSFTFQMTLNMDDPAFNGNTSPWYNGQDGQIAFWFGGMTVDSDDDAYTGLYEGNIILQGQEVPVPEPATMLLFGVGMAGLVGSRFRRKKK